MAEKTMKLSGSGVKPVPMKLFATWEVEKSSPNCIPRLCSLTLTRLVVLQKLESELTSIIIAVKMQSSKRTLRSNEILIPPNGVLDTDLDLSFSLQYPHFLKRDGNKLHIMLQRRKKYKNRTILGYKTLAIGQINMAQVLQHSFDRELNLYSDIKERTNVVAQVMMLSLTSQPVDHEENGRRKPRHPGEVDRSPDIDNDSDDDEPHDYNDNEDWSGDDMSDLEPMDDDSRPVRPRKTSHGPIRQVTTRQRNIKQKFIALLRRFKVSEEVLDSEQDPDQDLGDADQNQQEIEDLLFAELEDMSDSGPEMDTMSVLSTPKPSLRPFFTGRCNSQDILEVPKDSSRYSDDSSKRNDSDSHPENLTDHEHSDPSSPPKDDKREGAKTKLFSRDRSVSLKGEKRAKRETKERRNSYGNIEGVKPYSPIYQARKLSYCLVLHEHENGPELEPRKALLEQLAAVLGTDEYLPECFILVNTSDGPGQALALKLQEAHYKVICTCSKADVKASVSHFVSKLQKYCNSNNKAPIPVKIGIAGGDGYVNSVLRPYVEQFSAKSPDWQSYIKFYLIPLGASLIGKYIASIDCSYCSIFGDTWWRDTFDKIDNQKSDMFEVVNRIKRYLSSANNLLQLPIAEAMVTYKEKSTDEESSQIFIPFLNEVRIGPADLTQSMSVDLDELLPSATLSGSPPSQQSYMEKVRDQHTPPNSPSINNVVASCSQSGGSQPSPSGAFSSPGGEYMDLQLDYWTMLPRSETSEIKEKLSKKESTKTTVKQEGAKVSKPDSARVTVKQDSSKNILKSESTKASLKTGFKCVQVFRLPQIGEGLSVCMSMIVVAKEKKGKIMRIGKKSKETESKSQMIESINRLICTSKSQTTPLKVTIDGIDWAGVKFFQLSSTWQTHIKHFPVAVFTYTEP
ncbi:phosphofurin acidic cluster sorting protein 2-like isoform X2 [Lineus longissimus]|uniref:phosphofurin acidic cluster sorting protein 2-like isoform X2 n=1 Tax=Lineus longissimus TaxID=88925 RepID=UPI00315C65E3